MIKLVVVWLEGTKVDGEIQLKHSATRILSCFCHDVSRSCALRRMRTCRNRVCCAFASFASMEEYVMAVATEHLAHDTRTFCYTGFDRMLIGDSWRPGRSDRRIRDVDPYTGATLLELNSANAQDLDEAYAAAAAAQPQWAARPPTERAQVMQQAMAILGERTDEIVSWLIRESGSTRLKATLECATTSALLREAARVPYDAQGRLLPSDVSGKECRVPRKPVGVVGIISPWNWPLHLTARSLAPALATGNGAVVKPSSDTPVTGGLLLARIFEEVDCRPAC
jgi:aldehyde dehydrogenase (NAD+)